MQEEELTDEGMIARIQQGEQRYLELLIRKYYDDIYYFCSYKIGDRQQAYDCTQETFLKLTRSIHGYKERQKFKGYLFSIARNVFCSYKIGDRQQAYDCTQETFLKLTRSIHGYKERQKFKGYLFSIARNVCMDYFRGKRPVVTDPEELLSLTADKDAFGKMELAQVLFQALKELTAEQREVVVLRFYHDFKLKEIARIVGVPLPTAKSRLKRGMAKLKEILEKEGVTHEG